MLVLWPRGGAWGSVTPSSDVSLATLLHRADFNGYGDELHHVQPCLCAARYKKGGGGGGGQGGNLISSLPPFRNSGSLVMDPFVGTGSILVAAAHRGAITMGIDIDIRILQSKDFGKVQSMKKKRNW